MINKEYFSTRGTNIHKEFKYIYIYMQDKPPKISVFVTQFRGTRLVLVSSLRFENRQKPKMQ